MNKGEKYNKWEVLEVLKGSKCICKCECGTIKTVYKNHIVSGKSKSCGCLRSSGQASINKKLGYIKNSSTSSDMVGNIYNNIKVIDYDKENPSNIICLCPICKKEFVTDKYRLRRNTIKSCQQCSFAYVSKKAQNFRQDYITTEGSDIIRISRKTKNKNNTSGYTGVYYNKNGFYFAEITFKRKTYYLGSFPDIEGAIFARKEAEENIYGDFIEYYKKKYPDKWEKIKNKI